MLAGNNQHQITDLLAKLDADGLIVHINPLQEWFQPEGDRLKSSPIETLTKLCSVINIKIIVKEVGQGLGPKSLKALLDLPIDAIELAAFGGTNFTKLEQIRGENLENYSSFVKIGHTADEMISFLNALRKENINYRKKEIIISGGVENILDGFYLLENLNFNSVIGQAKNFLKHAENYDDLKKFTATQVNGLKMAKAVLMTRNQETL